MSPSEGRKKMYKIQLSSGWSTRDYVTGLTEAEAIEICEDNGWRFLDENCFEWSMSYVEDYGNAE